MKLRQLKDIHKPQHQVFTISKTLPSSNHPSTEAAISENNKRHKKSQNTTLIDEDSIFSGIKGNLISKRVVQ